jgi:Alkaline phosphatase
MVIVTADHASSMVYSGFATPKDYSILGMDKFVSNVNKKPYQLLMYSSGLGFDSYNETAAVNDHRNSYHKATVPSTWANHGASDVPLYAIGSLANLLFSGTIDQTYIPHAIAFAMCLFEYQDRCQIQKFVPKQAETPRERKPSSVYLLKQQLLQNKRFEQKHNKLETVEEISRGVESSSSSVKSSDLSSESSTEVFNDSGADLINFVNNTDLLLTSDLIGNLTEMESEGSKPSSLLTLVLLLVIIIEIVS